MAAIALALIGTITIAGSAAALALMLADLWSGGPNGRD
jgi:hypothetical protein